MIKLAEAWMAGVAPELERSGAAVEGFPMQGEAPIHRYKKKSLGNPVGIPPAAK